MTATTIDVHEAETQLLQLLALALKGGDVVIAKDNIPLVRLVPVKAQKKRRIPGLHKGAMRMHNELNIWEAASDEDWLNFEQRLQFATSKRETQPGLSFSLRAGRLFW